MVLKMAGDGPLRSVWQEEATRIVSRNTNIQVMFSGWCAPPALEAAFDEADLLVVPSVWPEPFGLVGPEAGAHGLPAAAFAVGGIPEWLREGVNGHLAPSNPPTSAGLARAITECLIDSGHYARLRDGAASMAGEYNMAKHMNTLREVLQSALDS